MTNWNWLFGGETSPGPCDMHAGALAPISEINPATGLPMVGGYGGFDVGGSPFGVDLSTPTIDSHSTMDFGGDAYVDFGAD